MADGSGRYMFKWQFLLWIWRLKVFCLKIEENPYSTCLRSLSRNDFSTRIHSNAYKINRFIKYLSKPFTYYFLFFQKYMYLFFSFQYNALYVGTSMTNNGQNINAFFGYFWSFARVWYSICQQHRHFPAMIRIQKYWPPIFKLTTCNRWRRKMISFKHGF